ncbi:MAG: hypothetical protein GDA44_14740 [Prochloron sp. SP5CPC1]|nr:hypothetical protein [Candidatus Paraprochloron terpiosi SP5CPC1]
MNKTFIAALVAAGQLLLIKPATAITFNFSWRSDAFGLRRERVSNSIFEITGTVDINVKPGKKFSRHDVSNLNITLTENGEKLAQFTQDFNVDINVFMGQYSVDRTLKVH